MPSETIGDWLNKLRDRQRERDDDGYMTVADIRRDTGHCEKFIRDRLREAQAQGVLETKRVSRDGLDGRLMQVPAYRIRSDG